MLLPLLLLVGCYSPRDDLDQLCLVTDVVIADHIPEEHVMREIATRYKPRNGTVKQAWKELANVAAEERYPLLLALAKEVDYPGWTCPQLEQLMTPVTPDKADADERADPENTP